MLMIIGMKKRQELDCSKITPCLIRGLLSDIFQFVCIYGYYDLSQTSIQSENAYENAKKFFSKIILNSTFSILELEKWGSISQLPLIPQKCFCNQNLHMDTNFHTK